MLYSGSFLIYLSPCGKISLEFFAFLSVVLPHRKLRPGVLLSRQPFVVFKEMLVCFISHLSGPWREIDLNSPARYYQRRRSGVTSAVWGMGEGGTCAEALDGRSLAFHPAREASAAGDGERAREGRVGPAGS